MIGAWATENHVLLGGLEASSGEVVALPRLIQLLALQGCMVTIDIE